MIPNPHGPAILHPQSGSRAFLALLLSALAVLATACGRLDAASGTQPFRPWSGDQPVGFTHTKHIQAGLKCLDCHSNAGIAADATIPSVVKCAVCHRTIATDRPEVKKAMDYFHAGLDIPWRRVFTYPESSHVFFRHDMHVLKGISCQTCHGDIARLNTARRLVYLNMGQCVACHRQNSAPTDCSTCHR
jgi:c(7)-type cytochrome triheme protein